MACEAKKYLNNGDVFVTIEVIAEVIYVLGKVYSLTRHDIVKTTTRFLKLVNCQEREVLNLAIDTFDNHNLDFVDCVLYAYHKIKNVEIATFDKKLIKLIKDNT